MTELLLFSAIAGVLALAAIYLAYAHIMDEKARAILQAREDLRRELDLTWRPGQE